MTLAKRLLAGLLVLVMLLVAGVVAIAGSRLGDRLAQETRRELEREARLVANGWRPASAADSLANAAGSALKRRVTLIDSSGVVVGDSEFDGDDLAHLQNHSTRPEVVEAKRIGLGWSMRPSASAGDDEMYLAVKHPLGVVRVSVPTTQFRQIVSGARRDVLVAGLIALAGALIIGFAFSQSVSRPIIELRDVARAIAAGELDRRPTLAAPGEVGDLALALHRMTEQLAVMDLTTRRRLETIRRDFVANVSHELKTPLTVIGGFAETLRDPDLPAEDRQRFLQTIESNTRRMQRIVDDLLDLSRYESGSWNPNIVSNDLGGIVTDVFTAVHRAAEAKNLKLSFEANDRRVDADPTALRQILGNLVENAVRHTARGSITVRAEPAPDGGVAVSVTDTGSGIPPDHLGRIFERFYRVDTARSRDEGGTGLGLAIVRHLVEAHGGSVRAQSVVGQGTTITLHFPPKPVTRT